LDIREEKIKLKNVQTYMESQTDTKVLDKITRAHKSFEKKKFFMNLIFF
jgi:hypothetical protein